MKSHADMNENSQFMTRRQSPQAQVGSHSFLANRSNCKTCPTVIEAVLLLFPQLFHGNPPLHNCSIPHVVVAADLQMMQHQHQLLEEKPLSLQGADPLHKTINELQKMVVHMTKKVSALTNEKGSYLQLNRELQDRNNRLTLVRPGDTTLIVCTWASHTCTEHSWEPLSKSQKTCRTFAGQSIVSCYKHILSFHCRWQ